MLLKVLCRVKALMMHNVDRVIAATSALATSAASVTALVVAFLLPGCQQEMSDRDQLRGDRNLICYVSRYLEGQLPLMSQPSDLAKVIAQPVIDAMDIGIKAIDLGKVRPIDLTEKFIDIVGVEKQVVFWKEHPGTFEMNSINKAIGAVHSDIAAIDRVVLKQGANRDQLTGCGPSH